MGAWVEMWEEKRVFESIFPFQGVCVGFVKREYYLDIHSMLEELRHSQDCFFLPFSKPNLLFFLHLISFFEGRGSIFRSSR